MGELSTQAIVVDTDICGRDCGNETELYEEGSWTRAVVEAVGDSGE